MWKYAMADYRISSYHVHFLLPKSQKCLEKSHKIVSFWKSMLWSVFETKITCFLLIYMFWSSLGWILPINTKNFKNISPPKDYFCKAPNFESSMERHLKFYFIRICISWSVPGKKIRTFRWIWHFWSYFEWEHFSKIWADILESMIRCNVSR